MTVSNALPDAALITANLARVLFCHCPQSLERLPPEWQVIAIQMVTASTDCLGKTMKDHFKLNTLGKHLWEGDIFSAALLGLLLWPDKQFRVAAAAPFTCNYNKVNERLQSKLCARGFWHIEQCQTVLDITMPRTDNAEPVGTALAA